MFLSHVGHVVGARAGEEVFVSHADSVVAVMQDVKTVRQFMLQFEGCAMGVNRLAILVDLTVAVRGRRSCPFVATRSVPKCLGTSRIDFLQKAFLETPFLDRHLIRALGAAWPYSPKG